MSFDGLPDNDNDAEMLRRFAAGDRLAAQRLAASLTPRMLTLAVRMLGDAAEAEDVAQEAMLRLWRIAPEWRQGEAKVSTWLYRVVSNLCIDRIRARRPAASIDAVAEPLDSAPSVEARISAQDKATLVRNVLNALPERQRIAITLRHFDGQSNPDISAHLGVSIEAVESLLARGRKAMTAAIEQEMKGNAR
ncbi:MAG: sigma-70 family RNA polymerase sigma factor [Pikeienuella sp.]